MGTSTKAEAQAINAATVAITVTNINFLVDKDGVVDEDVVKVCFTELIDDFGKDKDGNRVLGKTQNLLFTRVSFVARILSLLPDLAEFYTAERKKLQGVKSMNVINQFLQGGKLVLERQFVKAGTDYICSDGTKKKHQMDKYNNEIVSAEYGNVGSNVIAKINAKREEKLLADMEAMLEL